MNKLEEAISKAIKEANIKSGVDRRGFATTEELTKAAAKAVMPFIEKALDSNLIGRTQEQCGMQSYEEFKAEWLSESIGETI